MIVIIPYTTAGGGSARPVRGSVHGGGGSPGQEGDLRAQSTKAAEEESGWKGREGE